MAGETKDVELRIRARDYSQKTLEQLTDTLANLVKAQKEQIDQAKQGEVSARSLEKSYQGIENAAKALIAQHGLVTTFRKQSEAAEALQSKLAAARQNQEDYARSVAGTEKLTKEQNKALATNARSVAAAEGALAKMEARLAGTQQRMREFGIDADNAAQAQTAIVENVTKANAALDRQASAMDSLEKDVKAYADGVKRAADEEKRMRATQETQVANMWNSLLDEREVKERAITKAKEDQIAQEKEQARIARETSEQTEKQLQIDRQFADAQAKDAAKAKKAADDQAAAAKAHRDALEEAADQSERLAKEYTKLSASGKSTFASGVADKLRDIADPATAAVRSLEGVEKSLGALEEKISAINGPIKNYKATLQEVEGVQKSLQATAGKVDAYSRQMDAVRGAREEFVRARTALAALNAQARSGDAGKGLANDMTAAQAAMRRAAQAMADQTGKARTMREELRQAGVSTKDLAATNQTLVGQAQRARGAIESLGTAYGKYGAEVEKAEKANKSKWFEGGRTTLSWMQRIRGEVLGLATAYVGLQAAIGLASGAIEAYRSKQTVESRLAQVVGDDTAAITKEWDYLQAQANRLGFAFEPMALAYSKFALAAKQNNMTLQEGRFIFEKFAEGARVAKMSTDDFEGSLRAVEQMLSKGQIQAEELRGQLGDRLVGAMGMAAKAAGMTIEQFNKAMEQGEISAEYVIDLAREVGNVYGGGLERATKSFEAENARLQTSIYNFKLAVAEGGFIEAYTLFIKKMTDLLNSPEGKQLAASLSDGFTAVVEILGWCADNLDMLKLAFAAFMALNVFGWLTQITSNFGAMRLAIVGLVGTAGSFISVLRTTGGALTGVAGAAGVATGAVAGATGAVGLLTGALRVLARAIPIIGAALTAYEIYNLLAGKKGEAKKAGEDVAKEFQAGLDSMDDESGATADPGRSGADNRVYNALAKQIEREQKTLDKKMSTASLRGAKGDLAERKRLVDEHYDALRKQAESGIKDEAKRAERLKQINSLSLKAQEIEAKKFANEQGSRNKGGADQRVRLAQEVAQELTRIEDDLRKRETEADPNTAFEVRRKARLEAISHEYDKLMRKIDKMAKFDAAGAAKAKETVAAYVAKRQQVEGMKADQEELRELEQKVNTQLQLRSTIYEGLLAQYNAGTITQGEFQAAVLQNNITMAEGVDNAGNKLRVFAESIKDIIDPAAYQTLMSRLDAVMAKNNAVTQNAQQSLAFAQTEHNSLLQEIQLKQEAINAQEAAGLLLKHQAIDATAALNAEYRDRAVQSAEELRALVAAATTPENAEAMAVLTASLDNYILKVQDARREYTALEAQVVASAGEALTGTFDAMAVSLAEVIAGQKSIGEGFKAMGQSAAQFFAKFLMDIGMAILKQQLLNALQAMGGGWAQAGAAIGGAATKHTGGVVGSPGGSKRVDYSVFAGAAKFHNGGLPGLTAKEVPTILEKGEEVLTRDDPRNILNGGGGGSGGGSQRTVLVDDARNIPEAMSGGVGEQVILKHLRKNLPTIKNWIK